MATTSWDVLDFVGGSGTTWDVLDFSGSVAVAGWDVIGFAGSVAQAGTVTVEDALLEPKTVTSLVYAPVGPANFDDWVWDVVAGTPVTLIENGAEVTFRVPALPGASTVTISVFATKGSVVSATIEVTLDIAPHLLWGIGGDPWGPITPLDP